MSKDIETPINNMVGDQIGRLMRTAYPQWGYFLLKRPLIAGLLYFAIVTILHLMLAIIFERFAGTHNVIDLSEDFNYWVVQILLSGGIYYYFRLPSVLENTFNTLYSEKVLADEEIHLDAQIAEWLNSRWIHRLPVILGAIVWLVWFAWSWLYFPEPFAPSNEVVKIWHITHPIIFLGVTLTWTIGWIAFSGMLVNVVMAIFLINRFFKKNTIIVQRFHPDGSGGFGALGRFSLWLSNLAILYGIFIIGTVIQSTQARTIRSDYIIFVNAFAYIIIVPILFYMPLHNAHKAMKSFRDNFRRETAQQYVQQHLKLHQQINSIIDEQDTCLKSMDLLQKLEQHESDYPIWPFNVRARLSVATNAVIPLLSTLLGLAIDFVR